MPPAALLCQAIIPSQSIGPASRRVVCVLCCARCADLLQGTHEELMASRGIYWDMWQMQKAQQALEAHLPHSHSSQEQTPPPGDSGGGSGQVGEGAGPSQPAAWRRQEVESGGEGTYRRTGHSQLAAAQEAEPELGLSETSSEDEEVEGVRQLHVTDAA